MIDLLCLETLDFMDDLMDPTFDTTPSSSAQNNASPLPKVRVAKATKRTTSMKQLHKEHDAAAALLSLSLQDNVFTFMIDVYDKLPAQLRPLMLLHLNLLTNTSNEVSFAPLIAFYGSLPEPQRQLMREHLYALANDFNDRYFETFFD